MHAFRQKNPLVVLHILLAFSGDFKEQVNKMGWSWTAERFTVLLYILKKKKTTEAGLLLKQMKLRDKSSIGHTYAFTE